MPPIKDRLSNDENADNERYSNLPLWSPSRQKDGKMFRFLEIINQKYGLQLHDYQQLWQWSVDNIDLFWMEFWNFVEVIYSKPYDAVHEPYNTIADNPNWFTGAKLNYAENCLRFRDDKVAIIACGENKSPQKITFNELFARVQLFANAMKRMGVEKGDRVAGYIHNCPEAIIAMFAASSIGAIWSSTSPDFGVAGVLSRFKQISPKLLFSVDSVWYNGKCHQHVDKVRLVSSGLPGLKRVIMIPFITQDGLVPDLSELGIPNCITLDSFCKLGSASDDMHFEQLPFNHPLFIMYSSGTTGPPKCIVHSVGGCLLQHAKEHILHGNMNRDDTLFFYTTTGWMMWNWLVGALITGGTIMLYDGSPFIPNNNAMWDLIDTYKITIFGTSAKCLDVMEEKGLHPINTHSLESLHTILSTGSPLGGHQYHYVYNCIKSSLLLGSISGGTDIISCFAGQNWMKPVFSGEIQGANLGMAIAAYAQNAEGVYEQVFDKAGELVCTKPFPCMPTHFWGDKNNSLYKKAYFEKIDGVWAHGDFCIEDGVTHGFKMLGRSDATLNPNGVRFGSTELYSVIESEFREEILDSVATSQMQCEDSKTGQEKVILFVKMAPGVQYTADIEKAVKSSIRSKLSPRHVPSAIFEIGDIPYTINGKKVELAVKRVVNGQNVLQKDALRNPECLVLYKKFAV